MLSLNEESMKTFLTFLFLSFIYFNFNILSQENFFSLKLSLEKNTYYENETITARLKFINNDTIPHRIGGNCSIEDDIIHSLKFRGNDGGVNRAHGLIIDCMINGIILVPNKEYETFGASINTNWIYSWVGGLFPGDYKVYYSGYHGNSDTVSLKIISDENNDDYLNFFRIKNIINEEEKFRICRSYLKGDSVSVYNNYYLDELFRMLKLYETYDDPSKILVNDLVRFFGKAPNAWSNDIYVIYFSWYIRNFYTNNKMMDFLRVLIKKYPDTRVEYTAEKILTSNKIPDFVY